MGQDMDILLGNSLTEGDFGSGFLLRQSLAEGDFWCLLGGCYLVYRGAGHIDAIDYERALAVSFSSGEFPVPDQLDHQAQTDYFYAVRRVSGTGKTERGTLAVVKLSLDEQSKRRAPRPQGVREVRAQLTGAGRIHLGWWYVPLGQQAEPANFAVYGDNGTGTIDYESVLAEVPYTGRYYYSYEGDAGDSKEYRFSVRAVAADGCDDGNTAFVTVRVDLNRPESVTGVQGRAGF